MGLFDRFKKQDCEICGKEVGMFGYKKLEDGEICKECVKLLSPWFDDRRHSTVAQIKEQIAYREENKAALNGFRPSVAYGERYTLRAELVDGVPTRFVVERGENYKDENSDLISFKDVTSFNIDVHESDRELKRRNSNGDMVSYVPPRYEYSYNFYAEIQVNHPYFSQIRFEINRDTVNLETIERRSAFGSSLFRSGFDPTLYPEYRQYRKACDELEELFRAGMQGLTLEGQAPAAAQGSTVNSLLTMISRIKDAPDLLSATTIAAEVARQATTLSDPDWERVKTLNNAAVAEAKQRFGYQEPGSAPAQEAPKPKFCSNCGAPYEGGKFCQSCGSKLG